MHGDYSLSDAQYVKKAEVQAVMSLCYVNTVTRDDG